MEEIKAISTQTETDIILQASYQCWHDPSQMCTQLAVRVCLWKIQRKCAWMTNLYFGHDHNHIALLDHKNLVFYTIFMWIVLVFVLVKLNKIMYRNIANLRKQFYTYIVKLLRSNQSFGYIEMQTFIAQSWIVKLKNQNNKKGLFKVKKIVI